MDAQAIYMFQNPNDPGLRGSQRDNGGNGNNGNGSRENGNGGGGGSSFLFRAIVLVIVVIVALYLFQLFTQGSATNSNAVDISYTNFIQLVQDDKVKSVIFQGNDINGTLKQQQQLTDVNNSSQSKQSEAFHVTQLLNDSGYPGLTDLLYQHKVDFAAKPVPNNDFLFLLINLLPWVLLFGAFFFIARRATQSQQNIFSFGKSRAKMVLEDRPSTSFEDVAGVDEAKSDLVEVVEFLKTPQKFQRLGGKIPRGVLLVGPPGT